MDFNDAAKAHATILRLSPCSLGARASAKPSEREFRHRAAGRRPDCYSTSYPKRQLGRQLDLDLHALRGHVAGEIKCSDRLLETKSIRDKRFYVDLAGSHERQGTRKDMRVAKDIFDAC